MKYVSKPVEVEAIQFTHEEGNLQEVMTWSANRHLKPVPVQQSTGNSVIYLQSTPCRGVRVGDWIVWDGNYTDVMGDTEFREEYDEVSSITGEGRWMSESPGVEEMIFAVLASGHNVGFQRCDELITATITEGWGGFVVASASTGFIDHSMSEAYEWFKQTLSEDEVSQ